MKIGSAHPHSEAVGSCRLPSLPPFLAVWLGLKAVIIRATGDQHVQLVRQSDEVQPLLGPMVTMIGFHTIESGRSEVPNHLPEAHAVWRDEPRCATADKPRAWRMSAIASSAGM